MTTTYMLECDCPQCGTRSVIFTTKADPGPDKCAVCAERGADVTLTISSVLVNAAGDYEEEPDV